MRSLRNRSALLTVVSLAAVALLASPAEAQVTSEAPVPARLRHIEGQVSVQRAVDGSSEEALINLPLEAGDRLWTAEDGRAELLLNDGSILWLASRSTLDVVSLAHPYGQEATIVRLWSGSLYLHRPDVDGERLGVVRIDAPAGSVVSGGPGLLRADVDDDQLLWLSTYSGTAELIAAGLRQSVAAGMQSYAEPEAGPVAAAPFNTAEEDAFAAWRADRWAASLPVDRYAETTRYVDRSIGHYAVDLAGHGGWSYHAGYGSWGWSPRVSYGWTPYRHGRWVFTHHGWHWVPSVRWGWVTAHYGRWHHIDHHGWVWFPGRTWSPAWVQWYVSPRHVGWVPLNFYNRPAVTVNVFIRGLRAGHVRDGLGRQVVDVGPIGSASGTGRVVKGLGYTAGAASAWNFVDADRFGDSDVERIALARDQLDGLSGQSRALISGALRARQPEQVVPRRAVRRADAAPRTDDSVSGRGLSTGRRPAAGSTSARGSDPGEPRTPRRAVRVPGADPRASGDTRADPARRSATRRGPGRASAPRTGQRDDPADRRTARGRGLATGPRSPMSRRALPVAPGNRAGRAGSDTRGGRTAVRAPRRGTVRPPGSTARSAPRRRSAQPRAGASGARRPGVSLRNRGRVTPRRSPAGVRGRSGAPSRPRVGRSAPSRTPARPGVSSRSRSGRRVGSSTPARARIGRSGAARAGSRKARAAGKRSGGVKPKTTRRARKAKPKQGGGG